MQVISVLCVFKGTDLREEFFDKPIASALVSDDEAPGPLSANENVGVALGYRSNGVLSPMGCGSRNTSLTFSSLSRRRSFSGGMW